jgi:hypothetical protein
MEKCKLALFCDASFAGDLRDSKSTSGAFLCLVGPNTFVPITWICKKQGAVSHSSSEAEVISLDAGLRLEGIPALSLWDQILEVFTETKQGKSSHGKPKAKPRNGQPLLTCKEALLNVDYVEPSLPPHEGKGKLLVLEDNDAVIKMTVKGRSTNLRHVPRVHRIDLDSLFERFRTDPGIAIRYVNTKMQIADILTKGSFTRTQWKVLCDLAQTYPKQPQRKEQEKVAAGTELWESTGNRAQGDGPSRVTSASPESHAKTINALKAEIANMQEKIDALMAKRLPNIPDFPVVAAIHMVEKPAMQPLTEKGGSKNGIKKSRRAQPEEARSTEANLWVPRGTVSLLQKQQKRRKEANLWVPRGAVSLLQRQQKETWKEYAKESKESSGKAGEESLQ